MRQIAISVLLLLATVARAADDPDTESAKRHFAAGEQLYAQTRYAEALVEFRAALARKPLPAFHYNIALCLDRLDRVEEAIAAYQQYVDSHPGADEQRDAQERIAKLRTVAARFAEMNKAAAQPRPEAPPIVPKPAADVPRIAGVDKPAIAPPPPPVAPAAPEPPAASERPAVAAPVASAAIPPPATGSASGGGKAAAVGLGVASAALLMGGIAAEIVANVNFNNASNTCSPKCSDDVIAQIQTSESVGYVLLGVAGVSALLTAAVAIVNAKAAPAARIGVTPRGRAIQLIVHF